MKMKREICLVAVFVSLFLVGCGGGVDKTQDFAMLHNDVKYSVALEATTAFIRVDDMGMSESYSFSVMFPCKSFNRMQARGFQLSFDPDDVTLGQPMTSGSVAHDYKFRLEYFPNMGHKMNEGILLAYSSGYESGSLTVVFDILEPKLGGRVKGKIIQAVLNGYYESQDSPEAIKPDSPKKLEIFNFPFDTVFKRHPFS